MGTGESEVRKPWAECGGGGPFKTDHRTPAP